MRNKIAIVCALLAAICVLSSCKIGFTAEGEPVLGVGIGGKGSAFDTEEIREVVEDVAGAAGGVIGGAVGGPAGAKAGEWIATGLVGLASVGFTWLGAEKKGQKDAKRREDRAWEEAKAEARAERDLLLAELKKATGPIGGAA